MNFIRGRSAAMAALCALAVAQTATPAPAAERKAPKARADDPLAKLSVDIPYTRMTLKNGLTLIVHEDHSAPLVATNIWYHVGAKDEPKGKTGFAHLFEHLMFNGSENFNDDFFKATQKIGATRQNGTTNPDRTNYFQVVPRNALDTILWLESDRMGHLLGVVDQARLDEQRSVVKNEMRQGDSQPYAKAEDLIIRALTPVGHPYDHSTIGSLEDLDAATLDDARSWFKAYYGPSNAVLVLSGDITPAEALAKVERYFGDIEPGEPVAHPDRWVIQRAETVRETVTDRVAQPRFIRTWNISEYGSPDTTYLKVLAEILTGDRNSRLTKRLVIDDELATDVTASVDDREIGGLFQIDVMVKPGGDTDRIEAIVDEELKRLIGSGPAAAELQRVRTRRIAAEVRAFESISAKGSVLAEGETYMGDPGAWKKRSEQFRTASPADIMRVGKAWLSAGDHVLRMLPFGNLTAAAPVDRKDMPLPVAAAPAQFPAAERATLSNGLKLVVARRSEVPLVKMTMILKTGVPEDFASITPGTGGLAMDLMSEGTTSRTGAQMTEAFNALGATFATAGGGETSQLALVALKPTLGEALDLYADAVLHPAFVPNDVERLRAQSIAAIEAGRQSPTAIASRLLPHLVFGADSPYGRLTTEATMRSIGRDDLAAFHRRWFHPDNATLVVVGDTTMAEIKPMVERAFAQWQPGAVSPVMTPTARPNSKPIIYLVDKPGTPQSVIQAAMVAPPRTAGDDIAREIFNTVFGGTFVSRVNMKLREEKGWSYGARSRYSGGQGVRLFSVGGSVQSDKTAESMVETARLLKAVTAESPISPDEMGSAREYMTRSLAGEWASNSSIASYLADQVVDRLPDDYYSHYIGRINDEAPAAVNDAARAVASQPPVWIVVGDRSKIEEKVRATGLGEVRVIDAEGKPVMSPAPAK